MKSSQDTDDRILLNNETSEEDKRAAAITMVDTGLRVEAPREEIELVLERMGIINVIE